MSQTLSRSEAREVAFRVIFSESYCEESFEMALDGKKASEPEMKFINKILDTVQSKQKEIDDKISSLLVDWTIDRLIKPDLAVLRLAITELTLGEVPVPVIINENINIAKKYGTQESGAFINGILSKIVG